MTLQEQTILASKAKENNKYDRHDHELMQVSESYLNDVTAAGFIAGAEWERRRDKWIDMKDQLPIRQSENSCYSDFVLVADWKVGRHIAFYIFKTSTGDDGYWNDKSDSVTHWQPLPEPPK